MNAAKKKESTPAGGSWPRLFSAPAIPAPRATMAVVLTAVLVGGAYRAWHRWGPRITASDQYLLQVEHVQINPPPEWVRADVRGEVVRDAGLEGRSILDRQLTVTVAQAFLMHSWVEHVSHVRKHSHPPRVTVELRYRKPVAMVEVVLNQLPGLLPVDAEGVLLPPEDFSAQQTHDYLRISVPHALPAGPVGTPWGQSQVHEAARIAALFEEHWKTCGFYRIQLTPSGTPDSNRIEPVFELQSRKGAAIIWGRSPDLHDEADAKAALAKVAAVLKHVQMHGSLATAPPGTHLDLRQATSHSARTARVPP